jgi:Ni/Fe-hydrogenase 1 B-type cytochrome subunit
MAEQIRRVAVWTGWLRLAHWSMAASTLVLLATGWLIEHSPAVAEAAADYHYLAAGLLVAALVLRVTIGLLGKGAERFEHMLPTDSDLAGIRASLVFYLSLGRAPLPNWFAHNPLWKPFYLLLFIALALSAFSGWLMPERPLLGPFYLPSVHAWLADAIAVFLLLHLISVILQDWRGQSADISGMLNGSRYFRIDRDGLVKPEIPQVSISLDDIRKD